MMYVVGNLAEQGFPQHSLIKIPAILSLWREKAGILASYRYLLRAENSAYALAYLAAKSSRDTALILLALPAVPNWL